VLLASEYDLEQKSSELRENTKVEAGCLYRNSIDLRCRALAGLPVIGITLLGLAISWNTMGIELYSGMVSPGIDCLFNWLLCHCGTFLFGTVTSSCVY
jgi:hypothetical protein